MNASAILLRGHASEYKRGVFRGLRNRPSSELKSRDRDFGLDQVGFFGRLEVADVTNLDRVVPDAKVSLVRCMSRPDALGGISRRRASDLKAQHFRSRSFNTAGVLCSQM